MLKQASYEVPHVLCLHEHQQRSGLVEVVSKVGDEVAVEGGDQVEQRLVYYVQVLASQQAQQIFGLFGKSQCCIFVLQIEERLHLCPQMLVVELLVRLHVESMSQKQGPAILDQKINAFVVAQQHLSHYLEIVSFLLSVRSLALLLLECLLVLLLYCGEREPIGDSHLLRS